MNVVHLHISVHMLCPAATLWLHEQVGAKIQPCMLMQVAQLGEQQVQGCTSRLTHVETDLTQRVDSLKQQHEMQASLLLGLQAHVDQLHANLKASSLSSDAGQTASHLSELDGKVTQLQTAVAAHLQGQNDAQEVGLIKTQLQESCASQQETAQSFDSLRLELAAVKAELRERNGSKHPDESMVLALEQGLAALKLQLEQLSHGQGQEASSAQEPVRELEQSVALLSSEVHALQSRQQPHASTESIRAVEQRMSGLKAELSQLQTQLSAAESQTELVSGLRQEVATLKNQLDSLRSELTQHAGDQSRVEEAQELRSELAACVQTAASTEAAVAQLSTQLSKADRQLAELQSELGRLSKTHGQAQPQTEVEELNERLFELRVEVQNLADDTGISVASIKRKVKMCTSLALVSVSRYSSSGPDGGYIAVTVRHCDSPGKNTMHIMTI